MASFHILSGRRDSNPRPRPWQGRVLPLNYFRRTVIIIANTFYLAIVFLKKIENFLHRKTPTAFRIESNYPQITAL